MGIEKETESIMSGIRRESWRDRGIGFRIWDVTVTYGLHVLL